MRSRRHTLQIHSLVPLVFTASFLAAFCIPAIVASTPTIASTPASTGPGVVDVLQFGDATSEKAHRFEGNDTQGVTGALGEPARVSLPKTPIDYYGGDLSFNMKVDPVKQNYFTLKFWGSDVNGGQKALLYINGEQLGYRHLGDYEALNHGTDVPSFRGRFFYYTDILPLALTRGQKTLTLTIRTIGPISGYALGGGYDGYQGKMTAPSRGYYRAYTHTTAALAGLDAETQGAAPAPPPVRPPQDAQGVLDAYTRSHQRTRAGLDGRDGPDGSPTTSATWPPRPGSPGQPPDRTRRAGRKRSSCSSPRSTISPGDCPSRTSTPRAATRPTGAASSPPSARPSTGWTRI